MEIRKTTFQSPPKRKPPQFTGSGTVLMDAGVHGDTMRAFSKALAGDRLHIRYVGLTSNPNHPDLKQMSSLLSELIKVNGLPRSEQPENIALPIVFDVPLLNLSDQMKATGHSSSVVTHDTLLQNKQTILAFLKKLSERPEEYSKYIGYMDKDRQELEYVYPVIREINKAVQNGIKIYLPAGHPLEGPLKHVTKEKGTRPELYSYISSGKDENHCIASEMSSLLSKNWYNLNLLTLSDAITMGATNARGEKYLYSADNALVKRFSQGTYNLSPVRRGHQIKGYSFTNESTPHLDFDEFREARKQGRNIEEFVGLPATDVVASKSKGQSIAGKLRRVSSFFTPSQQINLKTRLRGEFVDASGELFFRQNKKGTIFFPQLDCEGTNRPSVAAMWGTCFSVIKALTDDILNKSGAAYRLPLQHPLTLTGQHLNRLEAASHSSVSSSRRPEPHEKTDQRAETCSAP